MIDIIYLIKDLIKERNLQKFTNNRFRDKNKVIIDKRLFTTVNTPDDNKFYINIDTDMIYQAYTDYDISNIDKNTNVLVIGANVGGFSLRIAGKANHVYAVEPVRTEQLKRNIILNNVNNITVIKCGLGKVRGEKIISWDCNKEKVKIYTMQNILKMCNDNINYLKMDCEGCEYSLCEKDFNDIQELVVELHNFDGTTPFHIFTDLLKKCGFIVNIKSISTYTELIHASRIIS